MNVLFNDPVWHSAVGNDFDGTVVDFELLLTDFIGCVVMQIAVDTGTLLNIG